jgi:hypothetical protein
MRVRISAMTFFFPFFPPTINPTDIEIRMKMAGPNAAIGLTKNKPLANPMRRTRKQVPIEHPQPFSIK